MQQLDEWSDATVVMPLVHPDDDLDAVVEGVKKAIREKTLESYKNGLKAGATKPARKAWKR